MLARVLAVISAASMVTAFALATLLPPLMSLAQALTYVDGTLLQVVHDWILKHLAAWVWWQMLLPVLLRPSWFLPIALGAVSAGGAMTLASRKSVPRSHRRRS